MRQNGKEAKHLKLKIILMMFLVLVFSSGGIAMAKGNSQGAQNGQSGSTMAGMDMNGKDKNMDMSGGSNTNGSNGMPGMDMSGSSNTNGSNDMPGMNMGDEKSIKETPPNAKILGTYGAINGAFIIIGVWNKWFRRKDGSNGYSK
jgi:hypothetical protein